MATAAVQSPREAFESRLDKSGECWLWTGFRVETGYGRYYVGGKTWRAHRYAYELYIGSIGGLWVLHTCDNPPCCNPDHLFLGTPLDNALDRAAKGRSGKDKRSRDKTGAAKLTIDDVRYIRAHPEQSLGSLAAQFGVSKTNVHAIRRGLTWVGV